MLPVADAVEWGRRGRREALVVAGDGRRRGRPVRCVEPSHSFLLDVQAPCFMDFSDLTIFNTYSTAKTNRLCRRAKSNVYK